MRAGTCWLVIVALLGLGLTASCKGGGEDEEAVRAAFQRYREALLRADGEAAANEVSHGTFEAFDRYRQLALEANAATVRALHDFDRLMVLTFRARMTPSQLAQLDGRSLFVAAVEASMIGVGSVEAASIGDVEVDGAEAVAEFVSRGQRAPILEFRREQGAWKWDMLSIRDLAATALRQAARQAGMSLDELIFASLSMLAGRTIDESIYDPPTPIPTEPGTTANTADTGNQGTGMGTDNGSPPSHE